MAALEENKLYVFPVPDKDATELYTNNQNGDGGYFPIGIDRFWHGAAHLTFKDSQKIVAIGKGRLVAYRINDAVPKYEVEKHNKEKPEAVAYSNGFALIRHEHETPNGNSFVFYSLYMHLLPWKQMEAQKLTLPDIFRHRYQVVAEARTDEDILDSIEADAKVVGKLPKGSYFKKLKATVEASGWTEAANVKKVGKAWTTVNPITEMYSTPPTKGEDPDIEADIDPKKPVTLHETSKDKNWVRISAKYELKTPLFRIEYRGDRNYQGYALLPKGYGNVKGVLGHKRPKGTMIPILDPADKENIIGNIRGDEFEGDLKIKTPAAPKPPPPPTADGGTPADGGSADGGSADAGAAADAGTPDGGSAAPAKPWYQTEDFDDTKYEGYAEVTYVEKNQPMIGFCDLKGKAIFLAARAGGREHYKHIGDGLVVRKIPADDADVLQVLPEGARITLKDPKDKLIDKGYNELNDGVFAKLELGKNIKDHDGNIKPAFDSVQTVDVPVKKGDLVGYAGPYLFDKNRVHFEIFASKTDFLSNPKKDDWSDPVVMKIEKGAAFLGPKAKKAPNPIIALNWTIGSVLRLLDYEAKESAERYYKVQRVAVLGWADAADLEKQPGPDAGGNDQYKLKKDLPELSFHEPSLSSSPSNDVKEKIAKGTAVLSHQEGKGYTHVEFAVKDEVITKGWTQWANIDADPKSKARGTVKSDIASLTDKMPTDKKAKAKPDSAVPAGATVQIVDGKNKTYVHIQYTHIVEGTANGWIDSAVVEKVVPPKPASPDGGTPDAGRADAGSPDAGAAAPPKCKLKAHITGLYNSLPGAPPPRKFDQKRVIKSGTEGTFIEQSTHYVRIFCDLAGEKTGWANLNIQGSQYDNHEEGYLPKSKLAAGSYLLLRDDIRKAPSKVTSLYTEDPHWEEFDKTKSVGSNADVVRHQINAADLDASKKGREKWNRHVEVEYAPGKKGWIAIDDPKVSFETAYDWPGWNKFEEHGKYSEDGFCDVPELLKYIDENLDRDKKDGITEEEIKLADGEGDFKEMNIQKAVRNAKVAQVLQRTACLHPTEWDGVAETESGKWEWLAKAPYKLEGDTLTQTKQHIKKMQWWPPKMAKPEWPDSTKVWHFHPIGFVENLRGFYPGITPALLRKIAPKMKKGDENRLAPLFNKLMARYGMTTRLRQAHFLGQVMHETLQFTLSVEGKPQPYDYRIGLGNILAGDGNTFLGRGLIQLTGRLNYKLYGTFVGEDLAGAPARVAKEDFLMFDASGWYWDVLKGLNELADQDDLLEITLKINGGYNGLPERVEGTERAKHEFLLYD